MIMTEKILITGFNAFGGETINPAEKAILRLPEQILGRQIFKQILPTEQVQSLQVLEAAMQRVQPDWVICVGQAGGRFGITPELVAINYDDFRIPDNAGAQPVDQPISPDGQPAYFSTLPIKAIVQKLQENDLPASISTTAGTFVCNHVFYGLMNLIEKQFPQTRGGFVHIPFTTSQVAHKPGQPSLSLDDITRGLTLLIETCLAENQIE